ncbi:MAG TPA: SLBB domain-containing protein [Crinalium sp.]
MAFPYPVQRLVVSATCFTAFALINTVNVHPGVAQSITPEVTQSVSPDPPLQVEDTYTLGSGDRIHLDIFNVPEYSGDKQVLVDGSIALSLVGNVSVEGMTLNQAGEAIATAYNSLLRDPLVTVSLLAPRPLRVGISGEINRPGSYALPLMATTSTGEELRWPTVTQAIQQAGGITPSADTRQIQIHRPLQHGVEQTITLNLWELLSTGDLQQDITLRDGDTIVIPTARSIAPAEATQLATASFSPDKIRVNVVGEVTTPGLVEVPPNTPLNQALLAAGGFNNRRARRSSVELIRLNPDGTVSQRTVAINLAQGINEATNPILRNNDVVIVGRSGSASFSDALDGVLDTLGRIFPIFSLF